MVKEGEMMKDYNCVIDCDVARLNVPLRPLFAAKGFAHKALLRRVPVDTKSVNFKIGESSYAAKLLPDGTWSVEIPGEAFSENGESFYRIEGITSNNLNFFIGRGRLNISAM